MIHSKEKYNEPHNVNLSLAHSRPRNNRNKLINSNWKEVYKIDTYEGKKMLNLIVNL